VKCILLSGFIFAILVNFLYVCVRMQANEDELNARYSHLPTVLQVGHDLIKADNYGSEKIRNRIDSIEEQWKNLLELASFRHTRLMEAADVYHLSVLPVCYLCHMCACSSKLSAGQLH